MDDETFKILGGIILAIITTVGTIATKKQRKSKKNGLPEDESEAREMAPSAPLMKHYAGELEALRQESKQNADELARQIADQIADLRNRVATQEEERELDAQHIDALEQHIWLQKPPPPPARLRAQRSRP